MLRAFIFILLSVFVIGCNQGTQAVEVEDEKAKSEAAAPQDLTKALPYNEKYDNGQLKVVGQKLNGEKVGKWKSYYPNGTMWSEGEYYKGDKSGKFKDYYKSGMLRYKGAYVNDLKQGPWYFYTEDGNVDQKVIYQRGEIVKEK